MSNQVELRTRITAQIVEALREACPPWRKPWADCRPARPANFLTRRRYSGINVMLLDFMALERGFTTNWWGTYRQWQSAGCQVQQRPAGVRAGEWGTRVVFCRPIRKVERAEDGTEKEKNYFVLREHTVFNLDQVSGPNVERHRREAQVRPEFPDFGPADRAIEATQADIRYHGDRAFYSRSGDFIQMPPRASFTDIHEWYATHFHELSHWSESRVGWTGSYALGELIAEIASCYMATELGVPQSENLTNHHAYLASWLRELEGDTGAIFKAAKTASAVTDFILSFSRPEFVEASEEAADGTEPAGE